MTPNLVIDVDLRNPGQFFACCGLFEVAARLFPGTEAWFTGSAFNIASDESVDALVHALLDGEDFAALADDHVLVDSADRKPLYITSIAMRLDWWRGAPWRADDKSKLKVWAGQQTPLRCFRDMRASWLRAWEPSDERRVLTLRCPTMRFGFDPSTSWEGIDVGFSPDAQGFDVLGAPATELLAAIGLQRFQPRPEGRRWFRFAAWSVPMSIQVAPAAMSGAIDVPVVTRRRFHVKMRNAQYGAFEFADEIEENP